MSRSDTPADLGESEPPHIKNWFSSYEYESFVLETNDNFGFSEHQGSQGIEDGCTTENTLKSTKNLRELVTNGKNEGVLIKCNRSKEESKCQKPVLESQDSPLLSPEPLGIENWFSSYAYESPEVDTIGDLIVSDLNGNIVDRNEKMKEFEKDENLCVTPDDLVCKQTSGCDNRLMKDDKNSTELHNDDANVNSVENGSIKLEEPWNGFVSCLTKDDKNTTDLASNGASVNLIENGSVKLVEPGNSSANCSTIDDENSTDLPNRGANVKTFESGNRKLEEPGNSSANCSTIDDKNSTDLPDSGANVNTFESGSKKLEEHGNGFVSTKSKKESYEKSKRVKGVDKKRCVDSPVNKVKNSGERVTLRDVTNILDEHSSVTGKWKCPRKRKPETGPPLKQLRLGQWFHHV